MALAKDVFPVPGGPNSMTAAGGRNPIRSASSECESAPRSADRATPWSSRSPSCPPTGRGGKCRRTARQPPAPRGPSTRPGRRGAIRPHARSPGARSDLSDLPRFDERQHTVRAVMDDLLVQLAQEGSPIPRLRHCGWSARARRGRVRGRPRGPRRLRPTAPRRAPSQPAAARSAPRRRHSGCRAPPSTSPPGRSGGRSP